MPERIPKDRLLADLNRVAEELGKSPSFNEYNEYGSYTGSTYKKRFGSWNEAKEAAGLETTSRGSKGPPVNIRHLQRYGPTPVNKLPVKHSRNDKRHGAATFKLSGATSAGDTQGGNTVGVAYLLDDYDSERVVRVYLMANPKLIENLSLSGLIQRAGSVGSEFKDAVRTVLDETDVRRTNVSKGGDFSGDWDCPLCGKTVSDNKRVDHLTDHGGTDE